MTTSRAKLNFFKIQTGNVSVDFVTQHANRMRRIISSYVACPALAVFSLYLINGTIFGNKC